MARHLAKGSSITLMAMFTKESGLTTKPTAMAHTLILKVLNMRAIGKTINSTVKELKCGRRDPAMKAGTTWEKKRASASTLGLTGQSMKANGLTIELMGMEFIYGKMEEGSTASGKTTTWRATESINGAMEEGMRASTTTTRKKATVSTTGRMEGGMKDGGSEVNSTGLGPMLTRARERSSTVFGRTERE